MPFRAVSPDELEWTTRPHGDGEPARHVAELSDVARFAHTPRTSGDTSRERAGDAIAILIRRRRSWSWAEL
jgi:hypothetical protein